jgi:hypothetical protein
VDLDAVAVAGLSGLDAEELERRASVVLSTPSVSTSRRESYAKALVPKPLSDQASEASQSMSVTTNAGGEELDCLVTRPPMPAMDLRLHVQPSYATALMRPLINLGPQGEGPSGVGVVPANGVTFKPPEAYLAHVEGVRNSPSGDMPLLLPQGSYSMALGGPVRPLPPSLQRRLSTFQSEV